MFQNILVLNFSDECVAVDAQSRLQHQKLFTSFIKCFSMQKQNGVLTQNLQFLSAGILLDAYFSSSIFRFSAGIHFFALLMVEKWQRLFFIFEKRQGAFLTSKKGQGAISTFKRRQGAFLTFKRRQGSFLTFQKRAGRGALRKTQNMNTSFGRIECWKRYVRGKILWPKHFLHS